MRFSAILVDFRKRFPEHGTFLLLPDESIDCVVTKYAIPNRPGVYVISAVAQITQVIYIGKAGTLQNDGTWKGQMLPGRLRAQQDGMPRRRFFREVLAVTGATRFSFEWFITAGDRITLPAFAESELLQAFFDDFGCLPKYNKCV